MLRIEVERRKKGRESGCRKEVYRGRKRREKMIEEEYKWSSQGEDDEETMLGRVCTCIVNWKNDGIVVRRNRRERVKDIRKRNISDKGRVRKKGIYTVLYYNYVLLYAKEWSIVSSSFSTSHQAGEKWQLTQQTESLNRTTGFHLLTGWVKREHKHIDNTIQNILNLSEFHHRNYEQTF